MRRLAPLLVALLAAGALLGLWLQSGGRRPTASGAPRRVVLFAPNLSETAFALGHGDAVVALTDYCLWPPRAQGLPRVGGMIDPNLERLAALVPDLLIVQGEAAILRQFAAEQGIRIAGVKMDDDLASVLAGFARVDSLLGGDGSKAHALRDSVTSELAAVVRSAANEPRPRALISLGHDPNSLEDLYTVGAPSFLGELLELAGAEHMFASSSQNYFLLSLETLSADPPQLVLEFRPGQQVSADERAHLRAIWQGLRADLRVEVLDFDGLMIPGPRIGATARALRDAVHPTRALPR